MDGLGIGLAFGVSSLTGVLVFIAVISHDFADGLNPVTFVLRQQGDRKRALRWLAADAAAPFFGAIVGTIVSVSAQNLAYLLAVYAGFFLYVGSSTCCRPRTHVPRPCGSRSPCRASRPPTRSSPSQPTSG